MSFARMFEQKCNACFKQVNRVSRFPVFVSAI
jgi:hypothetical protein